MWLHYTRSLGRKAHCHSGTQLFLMAPSERRCILIFEDYSRGEEAGSRMVFTAVLRAKGATYLLFSPGQTSLSILGFPVESM